MIGQIITLEVKEEYTEQFIELSLSHSEHSNKEEGVIRFDVYRVTDEPGKFIYIEEFKSEEDIVSHKNSSHFKKWVEQAPAWLNGKAKQMVSKLN